MFISELLESARCNQCNHMFFHVSFHKYTSVGANTGNMKATVIAVITCDYSNYFV